MYGELDPYYITNGLQSAALVSFSTTEIKVVVDVFHATANYR
jgi:hypothetical protein